jgi:hypothetical protein
VSHIEKSFNRNLHAVQISLLPIWIRQGYICRSPDITVFEKAKMRRRLSLAQLCALGEYRENSMDPGPRSCACRLVGGAYPHPPPRSPDWASWRPEPSLLPCGVQ